MKDEILKATKNHFEGVIGKHVVNVKVMLANPLAIHEHTDLMSAIEKEIDAIAEYEDKLAVLNKYFLNQ